MKTMARQLDGDEESKLKKLLKIQECLFLKSTRNY